MAVFAPRVVRAMLGTLLYIAVLHSNEVFAFSTSAHAGHHGDGNDTAINQSETVETSSTALGLGRMQHARSRVKRSLFTENNGSAVKANTFLNDSSTHSNGIILSNRHIDKSRGTDDKLNTLERNVNVTSDKCELRLINSSMDQFRHTVFYSDASFVYLHLVTSPGSGVVLNAGSDTVGAKVWVWTFLGSEGAFEYLLWPTEYGIWSLGLLYEYVINKPMEIGLERVRGNCSNIEVGHKEDDLIIAKAFEGLVLQMMHLGPHEEDIYGPSFFCYKKRMFIKQHSIYTLCKHIVCPVEAMKRVCCTYMYNRTVGHRNMVCPKFATFEFDMLWWAVPTVISVFLFVYSPIIMLYIAHKLTSKAKSESTVQLSSRKMANVVGQSDESTSLVHDANPGDLLLLAGYDHVTLQNTLFTPCMCIWTRYRGDAHSGRRACIYRSLRLILPFASLVVIVVQILIDYHFLYNYVLESIDKGVPLGFRSMLGGYERSKRIFLPYFGGPYIATSVYLFITCLLLLIPESFENTLASSLHIRSNELECSPLIMNVRTIGMLGSMRISNREGYNKIYRFLLAEFYMLLNKRFWYHCITIQSERWTRLAPYTICLFLLPFYCIMCVLELIATVMLYGLPIISLGVIMVRSYISSFSRGHGQGCCATMCYFFMTIILTICVLFSVFMFCTIFLDATLFVSRIFIFTFTGIIEYPKTAYGYMIFAFTIFYYFWESMNDFSLMYRKLFKDTIVAAESAHRANDHEDKKLVNKINGTKAIRKALFEFVIEVHRPRRKYLFLAFLKVLIILVVLTLLIHLLLTTGSFRELHVIMHVGTALFICALPQIAKLVCTRKQDKNKTKKFRDKLVETVRVYMEYFIYEGWNGAENELF